MEYNENRSNGTSMDSKNSSKIELIGNIILNNQSQVNKEKKRKIENDLLKLIKEIPKKFNLDLFKYYFPKKRSNFSQMISIFFESIKKCEELRLNSMKGEFILEMEYSLRILKQNTIKWKELFFAIYLINKRKTFDYPIDKLLQIIQSYLDDKDSSKNVELFDFATEGKKHLKKNKLDLTNSLLGNTVSEEVVSELENEMNKIETKSLFSIEDLTGKVMTWGEIANEKELKKQVENFCKFLTKQTELKEGDLVIYQDPKKHSKYKYGRFHKHINMHFVYIFTSPLEGTVVDLSRKNVKKISPDLVCFLSSSLDLDYSHLVRNSIVKKTKKYLKNIEMYIQIFIRNIFLNSGFDEEICLKVEKNDYFKKNQDLIKIDEMLKNFKDFQMMKSIAEKISPQKEKDHFFCFEAKYKYIQKLTKMKTEKLISLRADTMQKEILSYISNDMLNLKMTSYLQGLLNSLSSDIENCKNMIENYLNGKQQVSLMRWVNNTIHFCSKSYLISKGYLEDCTCYEYTNLPPLNFQGVLSNHSILKSILEEHEKIENNFEDKKSNQKQIKLSKINRLSSFPSLNKISFVKGKKEDLFENDIKFFNFQQYFWKEKSFSEFVLEMQEKIFPVISLHLSNSILVLSHLLDIPLINKIDLSNIKKTFQMKSDSFDPKISKMITSTLSELDQLSLFLDFKKDKNRMNSKTFSIDYLCIQKIMIKQHEMKTVIDIWGTKLGETLK